MDGQIERSVHAHVLLHLVKEKQMSECEPCNTVPFSMSTQRVSIHKILPKTLIFHFILSVSMGRCFLQFLPAPSHMIDFHLGCNYAHNNF